MYDGVETHGKLHAARMYDTFYRRMGVLLQAVTVIASASINEGNKDSVMSSMKRLTEMVYPDDPKKKAAQDKLLKDTLTREGAKSYKIAKLNLGERK